MIELSIELELFDKGLESSGVALLMFLGLFVVGMTMFSFKQTFKEMVKMLEKSSVLKDFKIYVFGY